MSSLPKIILGSSYFAINIPNRYLGCSQGFKDPSCAILNIECPNLNNFIASRKHVEKSFKNAYTILDIICKMSHIVISRAVLKLASEKSGMALNN
jgi:hypothetical protein